MKKLMLSTAVTAVLFSTTVFAGGHGRDKAFGKHHSGYDKIYRKLDLNAAQKKRIKAIFSTVGDKKFKTPPNQSYRALSDKRMMLIEAKTFDKAAAKRLADEQFDAVKARFVMMTEAEHKAWQVLTPEQRQQAKKLMEKRRQRMQKRMRKHQKYPKHQKYQNKNRDNAGS